MEYYFGEDQKFVKIDAPNIEVAKKIFMATELYPENYVEYKYIYKKTQEYDDVLERYIHKTKPGAKIKIQTCEDKWETVGYISLKDCQEFDYKDLQSTSQKYLKAPGVEASEETLPVIGSTSTLPMCSKNQLREKNDLIKKKLGELEQVKQELQRAAAALQLEIRAKKRVIYILETFMGVSEEVVSLKEGQKAPEEEPLHLYQQKLYMDEEIGIWSNGGMDFKDIDTFDEWITKNYGKFLYKPKAICAFQIRRKKKEYSEDPLINAIMNDENRRTYFFIRNGENLYRIWSNIHVPSLLFPAKEEMKKVYKEAEKWHGHNDTRMKENLQDWQDTYLFSLLAIQGLIERTDILGNSLRGSVNLAKSDGIPEDRVVFIRDAETEHWIGDGRPSWHGYVKQQSAKVDVGTRVVLRMHLYYGRTKEDNWRNAPFHASWPSKCEVYTVEEKASPGISTYHGWKYLIRYLPDEEVWDGYNVRKRKKRIPFRLYEDEVLNFDTISLDDIDYYMHNRLYRKDYLDILPQMYYIKELKLEERTYEEECVKYIAGQLGWAEDRYPDIRDAIHWWKLKNKWKRSLTKDEAKAVRMILKMLKGKK